MTNTICREDAKIIKRTVILLTCQNGAYKIFKKSNDVKFDHVENNMNI
jgi:hypothetical protein